MIEKKKKYKLADFTYSLPSKYIAEYPSPRRDQSKLLVLHKDTGEIEHKKFYEVADYMKKNDLLLMNNTKVFPARLFATKDRTDAKVEVFYSKNGISIDSRLTMPNVPIEFSLDKEEKYIVKMLQAKFKVNNLKVRLPQELES